MAGCATPASSAGHALAGAKTSPKLTFNPDHQTGADHLRKVNAKGGDVKLCGMSKQVRGVFELVRMHRIFDIYGTKEDAVQAFPN
jgi:hypothetical protein